MPQPHAVAKLRNTHQPQRLLYVIHDNRESVVLFANRRTCATANLLRNPLIEDPER